ncbi:MAG: 4a-hydroxytetrahydrobiopterin dehydratase, partial [Burkholderiales bacterium]|nr:4a-hydroxytetrahydrobiopterin dehydratase [Burkholderiales bacterium]
MNNLTTLHCQNSASIDKLENLAPYLNQVPQWKVNTNKKAITRCYTFKNFKQTMFFINALAYICEQEGHHPDAKFGFNYCEVLFTT